jgi:type 1 glutamine amidotransferase
MATITSKPLACKHLFQDIAKPIVVIYAFLAVGACGFAAEPIRVLIVDGQNNHDWRKTTPVLKACLEKTGRFQVDVVTSPGPDGKGDDWKAFRPPFSKYGAVLSNYNGQDWPAEVQRSLEDYVRAGGGLVIVHAANNAFTGWSEYNEMIGLGWRGADFGPRITVDKDGKILRTGVNEGPGAGHGSQHDFAVVIRDRQHPVTSGLPVEWMHVKDELYHGQRGPAKNLNILATAFSAKSTSGTDEHEPMVWWIPYGKGKVFTTVLGHSDVAMKCVGFQTIVARGTEWVATGKVTQPVPTAFPTATMTQSVVEAQ